MVRKSHRQPANPRSHRHGKQRTTITELPETVPVKYRKQLPRYIRELEELPTQLTTGGIQALVNKITQSESSIWRTPACEKYKINPTSLSKGVLCLNCNGKMTRSVGRKFQCQICGKYGDRELAQSLIEWFLLISRTINNKQCREFLQLTSKSAASVILRQSKLIRTGNPPASIYTWNYKSRLFHRKP